MERDDRHAWSEDLERDDDVTYERRNDNWLRRYDPPALPDDYPLIWLEDSPENYPAPEPSQHSLPEEASSLDQPYLDQMFAAGTQPSAADLIDVATQRHLERREQKFKERRAYAIRSEMKRREERSSRLARLKTRRRSIERALHELSIIDGGETHYVGIRHNFVALETRRPSRQEMARAHLQRRPELAASSDNGVSVEADLERIEVESRPPLTQLVHRGRSLALFLTAVYVAHAELRPGAQFVNSHEISAHTPGYGNASWEVLAGMSGHAKPRARRRRVTRALDELARWNLVALGRDRMKYEDFQLLSETGSGSNYRVPSDQPSSVLWLPVAFFFNGWHLVLEPREIAMLFAIIHALDTNSASDEEPAASIPQAERHGRYGISGEAYDSIHALHEFQLISIVDEMKRRRKGKVHGTAYTVPPPYKFRLNLAGARRNALDTVIASLGKLHSPTRQYGDPRP